MGVEVVVIGGEKGGWTEKRGDWGRERRDWEDDRWAGGQKDDWQGEDWLGWGDRGERRECEEGSDERRRSADWEGPGGRGPLPGGHGGGAEEVLPGISICHFPVIFTTSKN